MTKHLFQMIDRNIGKEMAVAILNEIASNEIAARDAVEKLPITKTKAMISRVLPTWHNGRLELIAMQEMRDRLAWAKESERLKLEFRKEKTRHRREWEREVEEEKNAFVVAPEDEDAWLRETSALLSALRMRGIPTTRVEELLEKVLAMHVPMVGARDVLEDPAWNPIPKYQYRPPPGATVQKCPGPRSTEGHANFTFGRITVSVDDICSGCRKKMASKGMYIDTVVENSFKKKMRIPYTPFRELETLGSSLKDDLPIPGAEELLSELTPEPYPEYHEEWC